MEFRVLFLVLSAFLAVSIAYPYEDAYAQEYEEQMWPQEQVRVRRFQTGGGYSGGGNGYPGSQGSNQGGWSIDVDHERGGGTRVRGDVNRRIESDDGKIRGEIRGHVDRTYGGPNDGSRSRGVGVSVGGDW